MYLHQRGRAKIKCCITCKSVIISAISWVKNSGGPNMAEKPGPAYLFRYIYIFSPLWFVPARHILIELN